MKVPRHLKALAEDRPLIPTKCSRKAWIDMLEKRYRRRIAIGQSKEITKILERQESWLIRAWRMVRRFTLRG